MQVYVQIYVIIFLESLVTLTKLMLDGKLRGFKNIKKLETIAIINSPLWRGVVHSHDLFSNN